MTVKQLKEAIQNLPDNMDIFMDERLTEFKYGLVNSFEVKEIDFKDDPYGEVEGRHTVLILSED